MKSPFFAAAVLSLLALQALAATPAPKVLLVVSSEGRDAGKTRPGFEMDEFALAWHVLRANGLQVDVASPAGGPVEADKFNPEDDHNRAIAADSQAQASLKATRRTQDILPGEHQAIVVVGGKGAMFDLPKDQALHRLLAAHDAQGGVLAAFCHGPAVLASVKRADGQPLVQGRRMTGFTDEEEKVFGKRWVAEFPFWLETKMREQGALWEEAPLMMPKWVVDGRLITGQNPFSTAGTMEAVVRALGRTPVARTVFKDEASMQLVQRWLAGEQAAVREVLRVDAARYRTDLIGMLGYYQFEAAGDDAARRQALSVMELAAPHMPHPRLRVGIARAHAKLGNPKLARELLTALLADKPDFAEAKKALAELPS